MVSDEDKNRGTNEIPKIKGLAENLPKKIEKSGVYIEKHFNQNPSQSFPLNVSLKFHVLTAWMHVAKK